MGEYHRSVQNCVLLLLQLTVRPHKEDYLLRRPMSIE